MQGLHGKKSQKTFYLANFTENVNVVFDKLRMTIFILTVRSFIRLILDCFWIFLIFLEDHCDRSQNIFIKIIYVETWVKNQMSWNADSTYYCWDEVLLATRVELFWRQHKSSFVPSLPILFPKGESKKVWTKWGRSAK